METKEYPKPVTLSAANRALSAALRERDAALSVQKQLVEALEEMVATIDQLFPTDGPVKARARAAILAAKAPS